MKEDLYAWYKGLSKEDKIRIFRKPSNTIQQDRIILEILKNHNK